MKGELAAFVDTSVLVQAVCADQPAKQRAAKAIVERGGVLRHQHPGAGNRVTRSGLDDLPGRTILC